MKSLSQFRRWVIALALSISGNAYCCSGYASFDSNETVSINNITVQRDVSVGTIIASVNGTITGTDYHYFASDCNMFGVLLYGDGVQSGKDNVYNTNIAGVGIRVYMSFNPGNGYASPEPGSFIAHLDNGGYSIYSPKVELIKTGEITSGVLMSGDVVRLQAENNTNNTNPIVTWRLITSPSITQVACSIESGAVLSFAMGDISAADVKSAAETPTQTITTGLKLDCDNDANINATLKGTQNPDSSDPSVLALSGQGNSNVAGGVGVQLLYEDKPLQINSALVLKRSSGGAVTFPIKARYVKTKDVVVPGKANATATIDLTYQ